jgi:hypothetical protein
MMQVPGGTEGLLLYSKAPFFLSFWLRECRCFVIIEQKSKYNTLDTYCDRWSVRIPEPHPQSP